MLGSDSALAAAFNLVVERDPELIGVVLLSLRVSLTATGIAFVIGSVLGAALAVFHFPGRVPVLVIVNALLGLPPVVAGLFVFLLVSRSGPLGSLGLLFTPSAMIIAQTVWRPPSSSHWCTATAPGSGQSTATRS